jgi:hypothetical protein
MGVISSFLSFSSADEVRASSSLEYVPPTVELNQAAVRATGDALRRGPRLEKLLKRVRSDLS